MSNSKQTTEKPPAENLSDLKLLAEKANTLFSSGHYKNALKFLQKILVLQPRNDSAMHMLAYAKHQCGDDANIMNILNEALAINPQNFRCYNLMGQIHGSKGNLEEAITCYLNALKINPRLAIAYKNLGMLYLKQKDWAKGMNALANAVLYDPQNLKYKQLFVASFANFKISGFDPGIKRVLSSCLEEDLLSHTFLRDNWLITLDSDPDFVLLPQIDPTQSFSSFSENVSLENLASELTNPYLLLGLKRLYITSIKYEKILTNIRQLLLLKLDVNDTIYDDLLPFIQNLALQCWLNEYVYTETEEEEELAQGLQKDLEKECKNTKEYILKLSLLGCYRPLYKLKNAEDISGTFKSHKNPDFKYLITTQIQEPLEELEIRKTVPIHEGIANKISQDVRDQYEENPYPRWKTIGTNNEINSDRKEMDILVAGCGTGQQPASIASLYPRSQFLCVDLSLSSLSYAIRQCRTLNLDRLTFMQGDILQLGSLEKRFDKIYCSGVLHHMEQPEEGLKVLKGLLKPEGMMQLSLYSEVARPHIVAARAYIKEHNLKSTPKDIRRMRDIIIDHPDKLIRDCMSAADFFTLSQCRDLLFHVQEHRFTIPKIKDMLDRHNLSFLGFFYFSGNEIQQFIERFPEEGSIKDLDKWELFEKERPSFFINKMYNFHAGHRQ